MRRINHSILLLTAAIFSAVLTVSCKPEPMLNLSETSMNFDVLGSSKTFNVSCNYNWTASCSADWVTITPSYGKAGTATVTVSVKKNDISKDRSTVVKVFAGDNLLSSSVTIKQEGAVLKFEDVQSISLGSSQQTFEVRVTSNINYSIKTDADWLHYVQTKAATTKTCVFSVDENDTMTQRKGHINATDVSTNTTVSIEVVQNSKDVGVAVFSHYSDKFRCPVFFGDNVNGIVDWGDYSDPEVLTDNLVHSYSGYARLHVVTVSVEGASSFTVPQVLNDMTINLTQF